MELHCMRMGNHISGCDILCLNDIDKVMVLIAHHLDPVCMVQKLHMDMQKAPCLRQQLAILSCDIGIASSFSDGNVKCKICLQNGQRRRLSDTVVKVVGQLSQWRQICIHPVLGRKTRCKALLDVQSLNECWKIPQIDLCDDG